MTQEVLVHLVFDPFRIYAGDGQRVAGLAQELATFRAVGDLLRNPPGSNTGRPRTYVLDCVSWEHFRSLRSVKGVRVREHTPRGQVRLLVGTEPPAWLTDEVIVAWGLLGRPTPTVQDEWTATASSWLLPGICEASSFSEWLSVAASGTCPEPITVSPVVDWLAERLRTLAGQGIPLPDVVAEIAEQFRESAAPVGFARKWARRRALLPLTRPSAEKPLSVPGLPSESALDLARANYVPLLFPLPPPLTELLRGQKKERSHATVRRRLQPFYPAVVQFVHAQRYVLAEHVSDYLAACPPRWRRSERSTDRDLQHLVALGYLDTVRPRTGSPQNVPHVFFATQRGLRFVQRHLAEQGIAWRPGAAEEHKAKGKSLEHLLHEVLLSQFGTDLHVGAAGRPDLRLLLSERRWFRYPLTFPGEDTSSLVPDHGYVLAQEKPTRHSLRLHFVELDLGTLSLARWRQKLEAYRQWSETAAKSYLAALARHCNAENIPWRLHVIAHDRLTGRDTARLRDLMLPALKLPAPVRRNLWFTTGQALDRHADERPPLSAACWLWLKDARLILDDFGRATAHVTRGRERMAAERRALARLLHRLPRYTLLPPPAGEASPLRSEAAAVLR